MAERPGGDPVPVIPFADADRRRGRGRATLPDVAIDPDDDATIFYTSGTTGRPKGAVGTHRNMCTNLMNLFFVSTRRGSLPAQRPGGRRDQRGPERQPALGARCSTPPAATPSWSPTPPPAGKLVMMHHFDPERALELIERERITTFGGVPAMVMQVIDSPNFAKRDTSSVQSHLLRRGAGPARPGAPHQGALPRAAHPATATG